MHVHQTSMEFTTWGGARAGAGRKPEGTRRNVAHVTRPEWNARHPVHVTLRIVPGLESLRRRRTFRVVRDAILAACERFGTRLVHFSVLSNHVHLICEVADGSALSRAMKGLGVRLAKRLNGLWQRAGAVIADRYHARALKTPREVRHALNYVLHNARLHGAPFRGADPFSSGVWFEGWERIPYEDPLRTKCPLPQARTWLLSMGWKRHGPIAFAR